MVKKRNETHRSGGSHSKKRSSKHELSGSSDDSDKDGESVVSNTVEIPRYKSDVECGICTTKYDAYVPTEDIFSSKNTLLATKVEQKKSGKKSLKNEDILNNFLLIGGNAGVCNKKCEMTLKRVDYDDGRDGRTNSKTVTWTESQSYVYSNSSSHRLDANTRDQSCNTCIKTSTSETIKICKHCDRIFIGDGPVCATCTKEKQKTRKSKRQHKDCKCKYCGDDIGSLQKKSICYQCQLNLMRAYSPKDENHESSNIKICSLCGNVYESRDSSKVCKSCESTLRSGSHTHRPQKREHDKCSCSSNQSLSYSDFKEPLLSSTPISHSHKSNSSYSDFKEPPHSSTRISHNHKSSSFDFDKCAFCSQSVRKENYRKVCITCINKYKNEEYDPIYSSFYNKGQDRSNSSLKNVKQDQIQYCSQQKDKTNSFLQNKKQDQTKCCSQRPDEDTHSILQNKIQDQTKCCSKLQDETNSFSQNKNQDQTKCCSNQEDETKSVDKVYCCKSSEGRDGSFEDNQVSDDTKYAPTKGCGKRQEASNNSVNKNESADRNKIPNKCEDLNRTSKKCTSESASNECAWCGKPLQKDTEVMCQDCKQFFADARNKNANPSKLSCSACDSSTRDSSSKAVSDTETNTSNVRFGSRKNFFDDSDEDRSVRKKSSTEKVHHKTCFKKKEKDDKKIANHEVQG